MNSIPQITANELHERLAAGKIPVMIDVREDHEVAVGMIPGAVHIPMGDIPARIDDIPLDEEVVFICRSGARSQRVCEYLRQLGYENNANLSGGMIDWNVLEESQ